MAREFDRGLTGPPMSLNVDFTATGLVGLVAGVASAVVLAGFAWWAALLLLLAWGATHWLLRESGIWQDRQTPEVRAAQRHADYAYSLAVDPAPAKELRLFGLPSWVVERFAGRRRELFDLQYRATRLRERSVIGCLAIVRCLEPAGVRRPGLVGRERSARTGPAGGVRPGGLRRLPARVRRAELGARRRRRPRRGRQSAGVGDGPARRAARSGPPRCPGLRWNCGCGTSVSATRAVGRPSSPVST